MTSETQLQPYSLEIATIEGLKSKYLYVTIPPDDRAAYTMVMSGLHECREIRLSVDAWHKERKEWIVKAGKHYDAEKRRIHALVAPIEDHLTSVRKVEDDRKSAIKAEKERKEQERVAAIRAKIFDMQKLVSNLTWNSVPELQAISEQLLDTEIYENIFQEFTAEAARVRQECLDTALKAREYRIKWEQEETARKVETERLAKERQEQEAERKRLDKEKAKLEAEKKAEQDRKYREEIERKAKELAENDAREKLEREAKEKKDREEAEVKERDRKAAMAPDKEKLLGYADALACLKSPVVNSDAANAILSDAARVIRGVVAMLRKEAEKL